MPALKIIAKAAVAFYDELFHIALMGFVTLIGCLLFLFAPYVFYALYGSLQNAGQLIILAVTVILVAVFSLPGTFTVAGLYAACQKTVRGEGMKWHHYWGGIKEFGLRTWLIFMGLMAGYGIAAINIIFYNSPEWSPFPPQLASWLTPLWIFISIIWTFIHFYVQAFLMELVEPKIAYIYRNSAFLALLHPGATILFVIATILVLVLSVLVPVLLVFGPAFIMVLALTAVRELTASAEERAKRYAEQEKEKQEQHEQEDLSQNAE